MTASGCNSLRCGGGTATRRHVLGFALALGWAAAAAQATTLSLVPNSACLSPGGTLTVDVRMTGATTTIVGGQFYLTYDNTRLDYIDGVAGDAPFTREIIDLEPSASTIFFAVGTPDGGGGTSADTVMARLTFTVTGASGSACSVASLVSFASDMGGFQTKLSDSVGGAVLPTRVALSAVSIDNTPPTPSSSGPLAACYPTQAAAEAAALARSSATDNCPGVLTPTVLTVGTCSATISVTFTDPCGNVSAPLVYSTRIDNTPPVITPGALAACYADRVAARAAALAATSAVDNCGDPVTYRVEISGACDVTVTVTATDTCGNSSSTTYLTRLDNLAPTFTAAGPTVESSFIGFEMGEGPSGYNPGSISMQPTGLAWPDGWFLAHSSYDQEVTAAAAHTGTQSFRWSNDFSDGVVESVKSPPLATPAGETGTFAINGTDPVGVGITRFAQDFWFRSVTNVADPGMNVNVSIDDGRGKRMTFLRIREDGGNLNVFYQGYSNNGTIGVSADDSFPIQTVQTGLTWGDWYHARVEVTFYDGRDNDVVKVYLGTTPTLTGADLKVVSTTWEEYYRDFESAPLPPAVNSTLFRISSPDGGASPDGIYFDDLTMSVAGSVSTCPANVTVECDDPTTPAFTGTATATDNCDDTPTVGFVDVFTQVGTCTYTGFITRTWTATDDCGLSSNCVQTITINDVTPPVITCPPTATVEWATPYGPGVTGTPTAVDNCGGPVTILGPGDGPISTALTAPNPAGWSFYTQNTATGAMVSGPGTPPAGVGSFEMRTGSGTGAGLGGKTFLGTSNYSGTLLSSISTFRYRTYVSSASLSLPHLAPSINMYVDLDGNGTRDTTFVFEPVYVPGQGAVAQDVWQTWDVLSGNGWWYTTSFGLLTLGGGGEYRSLSHYIGLYPNARIVDWILLPGLNFLVGSSGGGDWANHIGYVDLVEFNATSNDFEPASSTCPSRFVLRGWGAADCAGNISGCIQRINFVDTTPPVITCPPPRTVDADSNLGCSASAATVAAGTATATDTCDPAPVITAVRSDALPLTDPYPAGVTTITWTATDNCGNSSNCMQTITVNNVNQVVATVGLDGVYHDPDTINPGTVLMLTRCVTFVFWTCPGTTQTVDVPVTWTITDGVVAPATVNFTVPCGSYSCATARDRLHTLRRTATPTIDGMNRYVLNFTGGDNLVGGNLNDDFYIDILDFGIYSFQFGMTYGGPPTGDTTCSTAPPHADINGNGAVQPVDFSFISVNFLESHEANCCGASDGMDEEAGDGPVLRIAVAELVKRGLPDLIAGDLDGDGWLDANDVAAFMMGVRPQNARPAATLAPVGENTTAPSGGASKRR